MPFLGDMLVPWRVVRSVVVFLLFFLFFDVVVFFVYHCHMTRLDNNLGLSTATEPHLTLDVNFVAHSLPHFIQQWIPLQ